MAQRSLYELMHGSLTVVAKQHFVYHFAGKGHGDGIIWNTVGTGTDTWSDEGFSLTPSSGYMTINFNNKRQYDKRASRNIWVTKLQKNTGGSMYQGMFYDYGEVGEDKAMLWSHGNGIALITADGTEGYTNSSDDGYAQGIYPDKWNTFEIESLASSVNGYINGMLNTSRTTNLSRQHLQPLIYVANGATGHAKYCEVWNT